MKNLNLNLQIPPFPSNLEKLNSPLYEERRWGFELWGGFTLCMVPIGTLSPNFFNLLYNPVPSFQSKYHPTPKGALSP